MKGMELCERFFFEVAQPVLKAHFPTLSYTAGLIGYGSDVLGYDDEVSTDHMWGPRFYLFLKQEDLPKQDEILRVFSHTFPYEFCGYSVHFTEPDPNDNGVRHPKHITSGPVSPLIFVHSIEEYLENYLGTSDFEHLSETDWLSFSEHKLLSLTCGKLFEDGLGIGALLEPLRFYPDTVQRYLIASNWSLIAEEQAFMRRCSDVGDEMGSILVCGRIAERLMRLCFLYCRQYAPYSKWFGTGFSHLPVEKPIKHAIHQALTAADSTARENALVLAQHLVAELHNSLGITAPVSTEITDYYGREIKVIFCDQIAEAVQETLRGTVLAHIPLIGSMSEIANFSVLSDDPTHRERIKQLYQ